MMKTCKNCNKSLSFMSLFTKEVFCKECKNILKQQLIQIEKDIYQNRGINESQIQLLMKQEKEELIKLFLAVHKRLEEDKELSENEIVLLEKIQKALNLSNEETSYDDIIRPYIYVNSIRKDGTLPIAKLRLEGIDSPILKKDEIVHFAENAMLKEIRSVSLGYSGGSHGVNIRIAKGISYRVGAHKGHMAKEDRLLWTSRGMLLVTNQRLLLQPVSGYKPVSIPLSKILSYHCFENGIEVYKKGREKPYYFDINKKGSIEIFGICLGQLLKAGA